MAEKKEKPTNKLLGFYPSDEEAEMFDKLQQKFYTMNKSEILRMVFKNGAEVLLQK